MIPGTSRCSSFVFVLSFLLFGGVFSGIETQFQAQTATVTSFGAWSDDTYTGLILAGDGNFYAVSTGGPAADWACEDNPANSCTSIDKITPDGTVTHLHIFERAPGDNTTPFNANPITEGSDGAFYGTTLQGGTSGFGTIFRLTNFGVFSVLYNFPGDNTIGDPNGSNPGPLTLGDDGNFYGIAQGNNGGIVFFQMTPGGAFTVLHQEAATDGLVYIFPPYPILQGSDGNFYTNTSAGFLQITTSGLITNIHPYAFSLNQVNGPNGPLVEGPDFNYYATAPFTTVNPDGTSRGDGAVYRLSTTGTLQTLYTLSGGTDGYVANPDLTIGGDGNIYGTTYDGGNLSCPANFGSSGILGCGTIFEIDASGGFHSLYSFNGTPADGGRPIGQLVQGGSGDFYGTTFANYGNGTFDMAVTPKVPAPIQLSFNPTSVPPGNPTVLTWSVLNAFSRTMRQCHATIQGYPSGAGQWSGAQSGTFPNNGNVYTGTATITPTTAGTYTYALTCGGKESGFATLVVNDQLNVPPVLPNGLVGAAYVMPIAEFSGVPPYMTTVTSGIVPPALKLNPTTGVFQGTPTQFGTYTLGLQVTDSNSPQVTATGTTTLTVKSGLAITTTALPDGTVGDSYSQTLAATGGVPPYVWSVNAGTLPNGIQLAPSTGILSGTPTKDETQNITLQVADSEGKPATSSVSLAFKIKPPKPIAAIEFTQSVQKYQSLDDLENTLNATGEPLVPIISGKPLVMRVYTTPLPTVTHYSMVVSGPVSGKSFFAALPNCEPVDQRAKKGVCSTIDYYFTPPSGSWTVTLVVNDSSGTQVETETLTIKSRDTESINLKAVQVCDTNPFGPTKKTVCGNPASLFANWGYLASTMPTSNVNTQLTSLVVTSNSFPYVSSSVTPFSDWEAAVAKTLDQFYTPADQVTDFNLNQRTTYFGFYNPAYDDGGNSVIGGHGAIGADSTVFFLTHTQLEPKVIAHETGHTLGLLHTNITEVAQSAPPGCFGSALASHTYWPFATDNVQSFAGPEYAFDVVNQTVKNPAGTFDLMSYCYPDWLSPIQYERAIIALGGGLVSAQANVTRALSESHSALARRSLAAPTLTPGSYLQVSGVINSTGVTLDPIFTQSMSASTDPGAGTYSIVLQGTSGQALYTRQFTPAASESDVSDGATIDYGPVFSEWIPVTPGASSIVVLDPNGIVLVSEPLTGAPPTVAITNPLAGFVGSGQQTVSWTAQSASATNFTSRIFYSIDSGTTWQLIAVTSGLSDTIDFSTIPGATSAMLRIDVSDGVNTGSATSVPFSVPKKNPSTVVINTPATGALQLAADPVYLTGVAYDPDDGVLGGTALQWSDSVQGALGSGSQLPVILNPGSHTITLTATDSDGNAITATTEITMAGGPPTVSLSTTNTSAFCVNATINALPGSQYAGLSLVEYSLDSGNTYTAIPSAQLPFIFQVPGSGSVTLVAAALDESGQVDAQSAVLTLGAGCAVAVPTTPAVTVSPSPASITTAQGLTVTVTVSGTPTPTGAITLTGGGYTSAAATLSGGSATINVPAGSLAKGTDTLTATYTPDAASSSTYNSATGTNAESVTAAPTVPTVTVSPSPTSITTAQALSVTVTVSGTSTPTGSVVLTSGNYTSAPMSLTSGVATISIPAGSLAKGTATLTATYTPDSTSASIYTGATGSNAVTVTSPALITPAVTVTPSPSSITTAQALSVTVALNGGGGNPVPTGSVSLTSSSYSSGAIALSGGSVTINVSAGSLAIGTDTLTATYTPDSISSSTYNSSTATTAVAVSAATVQVTVGTSPAGLSFSVDGTTYSSAQTFTWTLGLSHTIATTSPQTTAGTQNTFTSWSDGGAISHSAPASSSVTSYTAGFSATYQLITTATPSADGTVTPVSDGFYTPGTIVNLTAMPNTGFSFANWMGNVASASSASTTITMSAPQSVTANFTANAVAAPVASLTPATLTFTAASGATSAAQTATLTNTGNAALTITSIALTGANAAGFAQTNTCGASLAAGANCAISVTFTPASVAGFSATLTVTDNATGSPQSVTLSGAGSAPPSFTLAAGSPSGTISKTAAATVTITITPQNGSFTSPITFSTSGLPAGYTATFNPVTITPGSSPASTTLTIQSSSIALTQTLPLAAPVLAILGFCFLPDKRRRRLLAMCLLAVASLGAVATLGGCGGGFALLGPTQTATATITASGGGQTQTTSVLLTVQK